MNGYAVYGDCSFLSKYVFAFTLSCMSTVYVIATPIGNLGDITLRAIETLKDVDFVLAEDTRVTIKLLNHLEIKKKMYSLHEYSNDVKLDRIIDKISQANSVALVSDAGTPLVADPGRKLLSRLKNKDVAFIPIPGASSVTAALSVSGFVADQFTFYGFVPVKKGKDTLLQEIADARRTSVFFESPHRVVKTIQKLHEKVDPDREIFIGREMTKKFEQYIHGTIEEVVYDLEHKIKIKGEFTVVVSPKAKKKS